MTPEALAALHARCFGTPRPYTAAEFAEFLSSRLCFLIERPRGFALGRAVADEAELLTIAVDPDRRRAGTGRALLAAFEAAARLRGARTAFLEVSAENAAARALYTGAGYRETARRRGYYSVPGAPPVDAMILSKPLGAA